MNTEEWIELNWRFGVVYLFIIHLFLQIFPKMVVIYLCIHTKLYTSNQRWETATSLIASPSLPLFVKFNSGAAAAVPEQK